MKAQPAQGCREIPDMDCVQLRRIVLDGGTIASPEAQRHLEECPACKDLTDNNSALARFLAAAESPPDEAATVPSFHDIESLLVREQGIPARFASLPSSMRWALTCLGLCIPTAIGLALARADMASLPTARMVMELAGLLGVALALCRVWLRPLYRAQPRAWTLVAILAVGLLLPWLLAVLPPHSAGLPTPGPTSEIALPRAAACFLFGSALALPVIAVLALLGRRGRELPGFVLVPATASALAGLIGLELHCPNTSPVHLLAGHAPIALALTLLAQVLVMARRRQRAKEELGGYGN